MKTPRAKIPTTEVLDWLFKHHPELHKTAELDRHWIWLVADLRGDQNKAVRDSLKEFGFRFAKNGHTLPSGHNSNWAHSCDVPTRFKHRGNKGNNASRKTNTNDDTETTTRADAFELQGVDLSVFEGVI